MHKLKFRSDRFHDFFEDQEIRLTFGDDAQRAACPILNSKGFGNAAEPARSPETRKG